MREVDMTKRRAIVARLLACALPVSLSLFGSASAAAAPVAPVLVTTNPPSSEDATAASTSPAILGEAEPEDGIILKRTPFFTASQFGPTISTVEKPTNHPNYEIQIFQAPECLGSVVAHGTAAALEGVGILVSVGADSVSTFSAVQVDPEHSSEPSPCSGPVTYWEGNAPIQGGGGSGGETGTGESGQGSDGTSPGGPTPTGTGSGESTSKGSVGGSKAAGPKPVVPTLHMVPSERANDLTPSVAGGAPGASTVTVYASGTCSGSPVAKGTPAELGTGFEVAVAKNSATTFSAVSATGAQHSACSVPVAYTEDSTAPRTRITMGPGVKTRKREAVFRFTDITEDPPGTTFKCKVDKAKWKPCASPFRLKHLKLGRHALQIRATDTAGNRQRHPVKRLFIVVPPA
jgi:hypothetical protein